MLFDPIDRKIYNRVYWSHSGNNLIVFDKLGDDGYYDIFTMNPDGSGKLCLTCNNPSIPQKHNGNPSWHPTGDWIVFQSVNPSFISLLPEETLKILTNPGAGWRNDVRACMSGLSYSTNPIDLCPFFIR